MPFAKPQFKLSKNYYSDIKTIILITLSIVSIFIFIYFKKIYKDVRQSILAKIYSQSFNIEKTFSKDINYSKFFLTFLAINVQNNCQNKINLELIFKNYLQPLVHNNFNDVLGVRKYTLVNQNFQEITNNSSTVVTSSHQLEWVKDFASNSKPYQIHYYTFKSASEGDSLKLLYNIYDNENNSYKGAVILSYDIKTMIKNLQNSTNNINFIIIDNNLQIVAQSKSIVENIISKNKLSKGLNANLETINLLTNSTKSILYINLFTGTNYYIKKANDLPFTFIFNIERSLVRKYFFKEIIIRLVEIGFFTIILILSSLIIYKREALLRSKAEAATRKANKITTAKSDFLAFTAHEIRSPLGFILTGSEIMKQEFLGPLPYAYKSYAEGIHQNSQVILEFIKDILDENQIIDGKFKITNSIINIKDIVQEAIIVNTTRFHNINATITTKFDLKLPSLIGDRRRILQILSNLISNAIKYSTPSPVILITANLIEEGLQIEVIDNGIGMSQELINNVLNKGSMIFKNTNNDIESYGLGLVIVKMLAKAHEAILTIDTNLQGGTTITITFPKYKLLHNVKE